MPERYEAALAGMSDSEAKECLRDERAQDAIEADQEKCDFLDRPGTTEISKVQLVILMHLVQRRGRGVPCGVLSRTVEHESGDANAAIMITVQNLAAYVKRIRRLARRAWAGRWTFDQRGRFGFAKFFCEPLTDRIPSGLMQ